MPNYTQINDTFSPSGTGGWVIADLSGLSVPANSVAEVIGRLTNSVARTVGIREIGSSLTRSERIFPGVAGFSTISMHVNVDANQEIEVFAEGADIDFQVVGYWEGTTFTEKREIIPVPDSINTWTRRDLISFGVSGVQPCEIGLLNTDRFSGRLGGTREVGSSANRRIDLTESNVTGGTVSATTMTVNSSGDNGIIEINSDELSFVDFRLWGIWDSTPNQYVESVGAISDASSNSTWQLRDISSFAAPDAIAEFLILNEALGSHTMGIRASGTSDIRNINVDHLDADAETGPRMNVNVGGGQTVEIFHSNFSQGHRFLVLGYWQDIPTPSINDNINLFISGPIQSTSGLDLLIVGKPSGNLDLFIVASVPKSEETTLFIGGKPSGTLDLFLQTPEPVSSGLDLFLSNTFVNDEVNLYIAQKTISGVLSLFEQAALPFALFARGPDQTTTDAIDFIIHGGSGLQFTSDSLALFLSGELDTSPIISGDLFARVDTDFPLSSGIVSWPLFASVDGQQRDDNFNLFINAGANFSGSMNLFMQQDDTDITRIGFTPSSGTFSWFARVPSGSIDSVPLFIDGFFPPSGDINLTISGSVNTINNSGDLFIKGFFTSSSGDVTFFMNDPIGTIDKSRTLYIGGAGC